MQSAGNFAASSLSRLPVPFIKGKWPKARGDRDRWHGEAVTDEGAGFGLRLLCAGEFRRLRAASDFAHGGKVTKTPPGPTPLIKGRCPEGAEGIGTGSDEHFVLIVAFPRTPLRGTRTCHVLQCFRRAKSGVLGCGSARPHWGPERKKNCDWCDSASAPGWSESTYPVRFPP